MDVNGTKFHLLQKEREDWGECFSEGSDQPLIASWSGNGTEADVECSDPFGPLRLRQLTTVFRRFARRSETSSDNLQIEQRRGAASDQYGNIYWIDAAGTGILFQGSQANTPVQYWTSTTPPIPPVTSSSFQPVDNTPPPPLQLYGVTVTIHHYLVVGYVQYKGVGDNTIDHTGVLIFDLYQNNLPDQRIWPKTEGAPEFMPWDMAPAADGGVYILDRDSNCFWVLDKRFRARVSLHITTPIQFHPVGTPESEQVELVTPNGQNALNLAYTPISIESGVIKIDLADNTEKQLIFILDRGDTSDPVFEGTSTKVKGKPPAIIVYQEDPNKAGVFNAIQRLVLRMRIPDTEIEQGRIVSEIGHDFVYSSEESRFYVADQEGNQVIAFDVDWKTLSTGDPSNPNSTKDILLDSQPDYIPLRRWSGRALVYHNRNQRIYYDYVDYWVPLQTFESCEFARRAVILTPTEFEPGQTFDSTILGCIWHRILLDAEIPANTSITFRARASDDQDLLPFVPWEDQPLPYLRTGGSEIPYYRHPGLPVPPQLNPDTPLDQLSVDIPPAGTWELLFQSVKGRYLQLEITLEGTGRSTPKIYALRVWYPRFSYLQHYLPAIYREEPLQADFLDRWLANFEGAFTNLEDKIQNLPRLLDPRSTPAEALDWLAKWTGLILDPLWSEKQRRFFIRHANEFYKQRGTKRGLELTLRLYLDDNLDESTFWTDTSYRQYIRVEELCIRRDLPSFKEPFRHRFVILGPLDTTEEKVTMIDRIATLEKPAHTDFQLQSNADSFIVGQALLGTDTQLGIGLRGSDGFISLGTTRLLNSFLSLPFPLEVKDRLVMDRDQLGDLPEL